MSPLIRLLDAMKGVFDSGDQFDDNTHIPAILDIREIGRTIKNQQHISWMDCVVDDRLPRSLCILHKRSPKYFQIVFERKIKLHDRNYPPVDGLEPKVEHQGAKGACVMYRGHGLLRGMALHVLTNEVSAVFAEELGRI